MSERFHFLGIGGVGMAGLAFLLKKDGAAVSGCDKYATPRTRWLEANGIPVQVGHHPEHLTACDALIITPAVPPREPELVAAHTWHLPIHTRGEMLAKCVNQHQGIAVCGTHGKTTTATFTAKLLRLLGDDPAWCIGGETGTMPVAGVASQTNRAPRKTPLVVEADESDGTLALYHAHILVVTTIDYDHPEHFKTPADYRACFAQAERQADNVIHAWELDASDWPELPRLVVGAHNVQNARAAIEVALRLGHTRAEIAACLPQALAALPDRRFQTIFASSAVCVITDYAHHPVELTCAVTMARALNPKRLRVIFQPHRYTRTAALKDTFPAAFTAADEMILAPVYAAFEEPLAGGDSADLYTSFRTLQLQAQTQGNALWPAGLRLARSVDEAWRHVVLTQEEGDLILLAGAGDIIALVPKVPADLTRKPQCATPQRLAPLSFFRTGGLTVSGGAPYVIGQGSNTWFSDCATDLTLVTAPTKWADSPRTVPAGIAGARLLDAASPYAPYVAFMAGIPGTIGGWTKMNAGAFGHAFSEVLQSVTILDADGTQRVLPAEQCGFAYRTSSIPGLILAVTFKPLHMLPQADPAAYRTKRKAFPPRTCGSVFKNPSCGNPAGVLLEEAGAKALSVGHAYVWREHANVIVAEEGATSSDILALARLMAATVKRKFGIVLEPEIRGLVV